MDVEKGVITRLALFGDYFGNGDSVELCTLLMGKNLERKTLERALADIPLDEFCYNLTPEDFLDILLE